MDHVKERIIMIRYRSTAVLSMCAYTYLRHWSVELTKKGVKEDILF